MAKQEFTEQEIDQVLADDSVTALSGWTEPNTDKPCDEEAYRRKLRANHESYCAKIQEALDSVAKSTRAAE